MFCFNISAQEFAPYGAEWHYTVINRLDSIYHQAKSVDSIDINGKKCRILEIDYSCYLSEEIIVYSGANGDSVFWYEPNSQEFQLIYAFDAQPGDSWSFALMKSDSLSGSDSANIYVDSVGTREINGILVPVLYTHVTYRREGSTVGSNFGSDSFVKYIGGTRALFPFWTHGYSQSCHFPSPHELRCYEDSHLGFYETGVVDSCTHEELRTSVNELKSESENVNIFPNPVSQTLTISLQSGTLRSLVIYDLSGREVFSKTVSDNNQIEHQFNVSQLPAGAYVVKVNTQEQSVIKKLIKQ